MKVFVGYAFKDQWVEQIVIPFIETYGIEVLHGREIAGQRIDEAIQKKIAQSHAAICFLTRVTELAGGAGYKPSDWVTEELVEAARDGRPVLDVRETGVQFVGGLQGNLQRYEVDPANLAPFLLQLGRVIRIWGRSVVLQLGPEEFVRENRTVLRPGAPDRGYKCAYVLRRGPDVLRREEGVTIFTDGSGIRIYANFVPDGAPDEYIEVHFQGANGSWSSPGIPVGSLAIELQRS